MLHELLRLGLASALTRHDLALLARAGVLPSQPDNNGCRASLQAKREGVPTTFSVYSTTRRPPGTAPRRLQRPKPTKNSATFYGGRYVDLRSQDADTDSDEEIVSSFTDTSLTETCSDSVSDSDSDSDSSDNDIPTGGTSRPRSPQEEQEECWNLIRDLEANDMKIERIALEHKALIERRSMLENHVAVVIAADLVESTEEVHALTATWPSTSSGRAQVAPAPHHTAAADQVLQTSTSKSSPPSHEPIYCEAAAVLVDESLPRTAQAEAHVTQALLDEERQARLGACKVRVTKTWYA